MSDHFSAAVSGITIQVYLQTIPPEFWTPTDSQRAMMYIRNDIAEIHSFGK
jgi:hypothetical protein